MPCFDSPRFECYTSLMGSSTFAEPDSPERDLDRLVRRLDRHRLWHCLITIVPPLLFLGYAAVLLFVLERIGADLLVCSVAAIVGVALAFVSRLPASPTARDAAARMLDTRADGKEHFLTLAFMHRLQPLPWVAAKLRTQAAQLLHRIDLRRDFPYRWRRSSALSPLLSAAAIVILHLLLAHPALSLKERADAEKVQQAAARLAGGTGLAGLTARMQQAAEELRMTIRGAPMVQQVMEQIEARLGSGSQDGQGSGAGGGANNKKSAQREGSRRNENAGGTDEAEGDGSGDAESGNTPSEREDGTARPGSGAAGERTAGKGSQGEEPTGSGGAGERDDSRQRAEASERRDHGEREGGPPGGSGEPDEAIPRGKEPDRFHPPGAGAEGVDGGRFVTVALPKTLARGSGQGTATEEKGGNSHASVPVSNVPLPPREDPAAAGEKQPMPLEYERIFR